jgi:hypothetical protein
MIKIFCLIILSLLYSCGKPANTKPISNPEVSSCRPPIDISNFTISSEINNSNYENDFNLVDHDLLYNTSDESVEYSEFDQNSELLEYCENRYGVNSEDSYQSELEDECLFD